MCMNNRPLQLHIQYYNIIMNVQQSIKQWYYLNMLNGLAYVDYLIKMVAENNNTYIIYK